MGQLAAIGFGEVSGIRSETDPGQIHLGQMGGDGRFFVGIPGHGHLIDQVLVGGLKVDQRQGFVGFGLLEFGRDFTELLRGGL